MDGFLVATLLVLSLLPTMVGRFPPLHDYPNGVFQSYLLRLAVQNPGTVLQYYDLVRAPVPYSAWAIVGSLLGYVLPSAETAGKVFLALATVTFVSGASYLIRSVQGRPTTAELLPLAWVYGRFVYDGILNYHLSLGLCLLAAGYLHRATQGGHTAPSFRAVLVLSGLSIVTYLSHVLGWAPLCLVVATYSGLICLRRRSFQGIRLAWSLAPALILLGWYTLGRVGTAASGTVLYPSLAIKLYTWAPVLMLFFRLDPFGIQPPLALVLNVMALTAMLAMMLAFASRHGKGLGRIRFTTAPMASALVCFGCAAIIPFYLFAAMGPPDARFLQPALWLAIASVHYRPRSRSHMLMMVLLVLLVLTVNTVQFARVQPLLGNVFETLTQVIPPDARVLSVSLRSAPLSVGEVAGKTGLANVTVGMPILDYFDLYRFMSQGRYHADLGMFGVGWITNRATGVPPQLRLVAMSNRNLPESARAILLQEEAWDYVELFGYTDDIRAVAALLDPVFRPVASAPYFVVLSRNQTAQ
ncbi:MAG: hypothetical protein FJ026_04355 [Chloroflexi bacterium]|nr:hypothetical protein [Chloroflexota bacterium]